MKFVEFLQKNRNKEIIFLDKEQVQIGFDDNINQLFFVTVAGLEKDPACVYEMTANSGYKTYTNRTLCLFYRNRKKDHPSYLQICARLGMSSSVSFMDRKDLIEYLEGISETSVYLESIKSKESGIINQGGIKDTNSKSAEKPSSEKALFGFDLAIKRAALTPFAREDLAAIKKIRTLQRTVNNTGNVLCVRGLKGFANIEKPAFASFLTAVKDVKKLGSLSAAKVATAVRSQSPRDAKKAKLAETPIIIVPAAATSLLTLYNVKEFLIDQKFVPSQEMIQQGEKKQSSVYITRDPKTVLQSSGHSKFLVLDSVDSLTSSDWNRVVAVFATGQEWQFKGWKWSKPVDIFHRVVGFSLRYQDDPPQGLVPQWKVKQLMINQTKRYLDKMVVHSVWNDIDHFMAARNANGIEEQKQNGSKSGSDARPKGKKR